MDFGKLSGSQGWVEVIGHRLGTKLNLTDIQIIQFALSIESVIPKMIEYSKTFHPEREQVRVMKEKADKLIVLLEEIGAATEKSKYLTDIMGYSLARKFHVMDFRDIYYFADALQGHLQDNLDKMKPGPDTASPLFICQIICNLYKTALGVEPSCYSQNRMNESGNIDDCSPYERVCYEIERRYKLNINWSNMRAASKTYNDIKRRGDKAYTELISM